MLGGMATAAEIQSALAFAKENDLSWADIAVLAKSALISSMLSNGSLTVPWRSVGSDGTSITRESLVELIRFCESQAAGGAVAQYVEFTGP